MKHLSSLFLLLLALNFIAPTQELQAYNYTQQDWGLRPADDLVFKQKDPNSNYPKVTVTTGKSKLRVPCIMAGKDNLSATAQNNNFVPVPDFTTGTVQDFEAYFEKAELTEAAVLNWYPAYMSDNFITAIKKFSDYNQKLNYLKFKFGDRGKFSQSFHCTFGSQPEGFVDRINQLYAARKRAYAESATQAAAAEQLKQQQLAQIAQARQLTVRQAWPENFQLLQQDIPEWQELSDIFLEHKFGDSARLQKRIAVLNQLTSVSNNTNNLNTDAHNFINQDYKITSQAKNILQDTGLNPTDYASCYGNQFQQLLHQENLDQLQQLSSVTRLSPIFHHKIAVAECVDSAREYNQAGLVYDSVKVTDMCWALIDYGKAICEGAAQGLIMVAKDLADHPEQALLLVVAGEYVLACQLAKVTYEVAKIGITAWQDPTKGQEEWGNYIAQVTELIDAFENNEISTRDALKTSTMVAVSCRAQSKLSSGLGKLCKVTKANAMTYLKNNPHATPQLYMSTPDGKIFKATSEIKKLSNRERKLERIKHAKQAAAPIAEFLTELSNEAFEKAVKYATTDTKLVHFFGDHKDILIKHNFANLLNEVRDRKKVVEKIIMACIGKIPKDGAFEDIPVSVNGYEIYVRGTVINGIPDLGTIFIK